MKDLKQMREIDLLRTHAAIIDELIRRDVVKTRNNPIGDYTEWLVSTRLGLALQPNSKASFDAVDESGLRYQIKGRRDIRPRVQFSSIRNLVDRGFDFVIAVVFNSDYSIRFAFKIPYEVIPEFSTFQEHTNGHNLVLAEKSIEHKGVIDIRERLA